MKKVNLYQNHFWEPHYKESIDLIILDVSGNWLIVKRCNIFSEARVRLNWIAKPDNQTARYTWDELSFFTSIWHFYLII